MDAFKRPALPGELVPVTAKRARLDVVAAGDPKQQAPKRTSKLPAPIIQLLGHEGEIYTARFAPDGTFLASAGFDMQIFLWNVYGECENFHVVKGHKGAVMDLKFATDSSALFTASTDKTVRVWDMTTGACTRRFRKQTDIVNAVDANRRGPQLVLAASDDCTAAIYDVRQKEPTAIFKNEFQLTTAVFSDTAEQIFVGGIDNDVKCIDLRKADGVSYMLRGHHDTLTGAALSPEGTHLVTNSMDCTLRIWDVRPFASSAQRCVAVLQGHQHNFEKNLLKCGWAADSHYVTAGSSDRMVYVWEVSTGKIVYKLPGHQGSVNATDFHPLEPILLSAASDKKLYLGELDL